MIITDVETVEQFLDKYYRDDRYHGRGKEYAAIVLKWHQDHFEKYGYDCISRHENVNRQPLWFGTMPEGHSSKKQ